MTYESLGLKLIKETKDMLLTITRQFNSPAQASINFNKCWSNCAALNYSNSPDCNMNRGPNQA